MTRSYMFQIGDVVRIIDNPNRDCEAGWDRGMDEYCGRTAIVTSLYRWIDNAVCIDIDGGEFIWSDDIVELFHHICEVPDLEVEESADICALFQ